MDGVKLKLSPGKAEFAVIGNRQAGESLMLKFPTQFFGNSISLANEVKNLGVAFGSRNTFASHIKNVCCTCCCPLGNISGFLSVDGAALLANSVFSSTVGCCISLLCGVDG